VVQVGELRSHGVGRCLDPDLVLDFDGTGHGISSVGVTEVIRGAAPVGCIRRAGLRVNRV
jgi:hypothetical protein